MIERLLDWLTMRSYRFYDWRLNYCKKNHQWRDKTLVDGQIWERSECPKCGFWEDLG